MDNIGDLMKNILKETKEDKKIKPIDSEQEYVFEQIRKYVGEADWQKSHNNYEKLYNMYKEQNKINELKEIIASCKLSKARNRGSYLNSSMRNGIDFKQDNKTNQTNGLKIFNVNFAEINPAWALERKVEGKRIVRVINDSGDYTVTIQNTKDNKNPIRKTMELHTEIERIYSDKSCPNNCIIEMAVPELLERLGWPLNGRSYDYLEEHLDTLFNTQIHSEGVYKYKDKGVVKEIPRTTVFNMIAGYDFFNEKSETKPVKKIKISLNPFLAQNVKEKYYFLHAGPGSTIKLEGAVEKFLYEFLVKRTGKVKGQEYYMDIIEVSEYVGIYTSEPKERKRSIKEALESFKEKELIKSFEMEDGSHNFKVCF
jgi:hypothetical protein